jgi:malonyl-CoA O-methyltransferase
MSLPSADRGRLRRNFDRAAPTYDTACVLEREACARLAGRLDPIQLEPHRVLDAGSGTGLLARALRARYPRAWVAEVDLSVGMLRAARHGRSWWQRLGLGTAPRTGRVCADLTRLPLAAGSVGLVGSNLALHWCDRLDLAVAEFLRVLGRGGLLAFSTLGPDTLKELRAALAPEDGVMPVHSFTEMHDLGDLLLRAGFADPVLDREVLTLTYARFDDLLRDLKQTGTRSALPPAVRALGGKQRRQRVETRYEAMRAEGRLPATFELIYGHAWKALQPRKTSDGRDIVRLVPPRAG